MNKKLEEIAPEKADLIKSLQELDISDEEIAKSLGISTEEKVEIKVEDKIEKSVEEQIAAKQVELDELQKSQKSDIGFDIVKFDEKFDKINKSISDQLGEANTKVDEKIEGLVDLMKSLADKVVTLSKDNEQLIKDNDDLKKSSSASTEVLNKLANQTPGLRSLSNANHIERFEKSTATDDGGNGKEVLSVSKQKDVISSRLSVKMDEPEFVKSLGDAVANFECSGKLSPQLEKAIKDDLAIELVA